MDATLSGLCVAEVAFYIISVGNDYQNRLGINNHFNHIVRNGLEAWGTEVLYAEIDLCRMPDMKQVFLLTKFKLTHG